MTEIYTLRQGPQYDDLPGRITGWQRQLTVERGEIIEDGEYPYWVVTAGDADMGDVSFGLDADDLRGLVAVLSAELAKHDGIADPWSPYAEVMP